MLTSRVHQDRMFCQYAYIRGRAAAIQFYFANIEACRVPNLTDQFQFILVKWIPLWKMRLWLDRDQLTLRHFVAHEHTISVIERERSPLTSIHFMDLERRLPETDYNYISDCD